MGHLHLPRFDPFLPFDDFHSDNQKDYLAGFPWHPHRGIETVTYVLHRNVEHVDGIGNSESIIDGDVHWITAGSGIIHQEMPHKVKGDMWGLQLWINLPSGKKMMDPRYRDIKYDTIPTVRTGDGITVNVVAGNFRETEGPVRDLVQDPSCFDVSMPPGKVFEHAVEPIHTVFCYVLEGEGRFEPGNPGKLCAETVVLYGQGDSLHIESADKDLRFLLIPGKPISEPIACGGPIVMNTKKKLEEAFCELREGTFIKG